RFAMLSGHYRAPLDWTEDLLKQAKATLDRIYGALRRVWDADIVELNPEAHDRVLFALQNDLNTPQALADLSSMANEAHLFSNRGDQQSRAYARASLIAAGNLLGLLQSTPDEWEKGTDTDDTARIDELVAARDAARAIKNWSEADRIRDELASEGIEIMDGPDGASWRRV
ncbi:MAG: DALR domain-containing protein, partial [Pseudomonadota bacterium]